MRAEEIMVFYPGSKEECAGMDCKSCGSLVKYLLEDTPFTCFNPRKSCKFWRD